jgi:hypothetical protein
MLRPVCPNVKNRTIYEAIRCGYDSNFTLIAWVHVIENQHPFNDTCSWYCRSMGASCGQNRTEHRRNMPITLQHHGLHWTTAGERVHTTCNIAPDLLPSLLALLAARMYKSSHVVSMVILEHMACPVPTRDNPTPTRGSRPCNGGYCPVEGSEI